MVGDEGGDGVSVEKGGGATRVEDCGQEEVSVARGEVAEDGDAVIKSKDGLGEVSVVLEEFGVNADIADLFELCFLVELVVVGIDCASKSESGSIIGVWEGVEVDFKGVEHARNLEGVIVCDA